MAAGKFTKAAAALLRILGADRCAIVGGMAVNVHGYVRATRDVDIMAAMPLAEARRRLRENGVEARLFKGNPLEGDSDCVKGILPVGLRPADAVPFDVLPPLEPVTQEHTVELVVQGHKLRVVDQETLFKLKLRAGGPNDLYDIAILVGLHPEWEGRVVALASSSWKGVAERLVGLLRDPRVGAQVREVKRQDTALRAFSKRMRPAKTRRGQGRQRRKV
jgi:hypothetical protein